MACTDASAGTGTTGRGVLEQNAEDGRSLGFTIVKMAQPGVPPAHYRRLQKCQRGYWERGGSKESEQL